MRRILASLLFICVFFSAHAQYKESPFHFAVLTSGHGSWIYTDAPDIRADGIRLGAEAELHLDYFFLPNFAFSTGVSWSFTGGHVGFDQPTAMVFASGLDTLQPGVRLSYGLQYLEIPIGLKIATREIGYSTFFTDFGLRPMILRRSLGNTSDGIHQKDPVFKEVTKFNLAYHAELGLKYSFGNKTCLYLSLFYKNTFLDFTSDYLDKPDDNSRINQAGIKVGFGF